MAAEHMLILTGVGTIGVVVSTAIVKFFVSRKSKDSNVTRRPAFFRCRCRRNRVPDDFVPEPATTSTATIEKTGPLRLLPRNTNHSDTNPTTQSQEKIDICEETSSSYIQCPSSPISTPYSSQKRLTCPKIPTTSVCNENPNRCSTCLLPICSLQTTDSGSRDEVRIESTTGNIDDLVGTKEGEVDEILVDMDVTTVSIAVPNMKGTHMLQSGTFYGEAMTEAVADLLFSDSWNSGDNDEDRSKEEDSIKCQANQSFMATGQDVQICKISPGASPARHGCNHGPGNPQLSQGTKKDEVQPQGTLGPAKCENDSHLNPGNAAKSVDKSDKSDSLFPPVENKSSHEERVESEGSPECCAEKNCDSDEMYGNKGNAGGATTNNALNEDGDQHGRPESRDGGSSEEIKPCFPNAEVSKRTSAPVGSETSSKIKGRSKSGSESAGKTGIRQVEKTTVSSPKRDTSRSGVTENRVALPQARAESGIARRGQSGGKAPVGAGATQKYLALIKPVFQKRNTVNSEPKSKQGRMKRKLFALSRKAGTSAQIPFDGERSVSDTNVCRRPSATDPAESGSRRDVERRSGTREDATNVRRVRVIEVPIEPLSLTPTMQAGRTVKDSRTTDSRGKLRSGGRCSSSVPGLPALGAFKEKGTGESGGEFRAGERVSFFRRGRRGGLGGLRGRKGVLDSQVGNAQGERTDGDVGFARKVSRRFRDRLRTITAKV